jgi:hypothetical protein
MSLDFSRIPMDSLAEKWAPVLDHADLPSIQDSHKRRVTAVLLENQINAMREERTGGNLFENSMGPIGMGGTQPLVKLVQHVTFLDMIQ